MHLLLIYDDPQDFFNQYLEQYVLMNRPPFSVSVQITKVNFSQLKKFLLSRPKILNYLDGVFLNITQRQSPFSYEIQQLLNYKPKILLALDLAFNMVQISHELKSDVQVVQDLSPMYTNQFHKTHGQLYEQDEDSIYNIIGEVGIIQRLQRSLYNQNYIQQSVSYENHLLFKRVPRVFKVEDKRLWLQTKVKGQVAGKINRDPAIVQIDTLQFAFSFKINPLYPESIILFQNFIQLCWNEYQEVYQRKEKEPIRTARTSYQKIDLSSFKITDQRFKPKITIQLDPRHSLTDKKERLLSRCLTSRVQTDPIGHKKSRDGEMKKFEIRRFLHPQFKISGDQNLIVQNVKDKSIDVKKTLFAKELHYQDKIQIAIKEKIELFHNENHLFNILLNSSFCWLVKVQGNLMSNFTQRSPFSYIFPCKTGIPSPGIFLVYCGLII